MDITEKNGQPSMEEILASIRRIIAEEPVGPPPGIEIAPKALSLQGETAFDEPSDFDLPSIFRTPAPAPEKPALFGRLTDAIRGATSASPESKALRNGDEFSAADHSDPITGSGRNGLPPPQYPSLSTLKTGRPDHPAATDTSPTDPAKAPPAPGPANANPAASGFGWRFGRAAAPPSAIEDEIKRVMTPFKDTRFQQMAHAEESTGAESPLPPAHQHPSHQPLAPQPPVPQPMAHQPPEQPRVDFSSIIPSRMDLPGIPAVEEYRWPPQGPGQSETSFGSPPRPDPSAYPPEPPHYMADTIAPMPQSPLGPGYFDPATSGRLPGSHDEQVLPFRSQAAASGQAAPTGTIEDTTAELLRPMLRQWLADNMPRMVEKALHIEVANSVRTGRKLPGQ